MKAEIEKYSEEHIRISITPDNYSEEVILRKYYPGDFWLCAIENNRFIFVPRIEPTHSHKIEFTEVKSDEPHEECFVFFGVSGDGSRLYRKIKRKDRPHE